jgi:pimeloyl-ACP methyl ester carboxylesterase
VAAGSVEAFFFGDPAARLFACHHPPSEGDSDDGVVLCYPMGHEYIRTHRLYRFLARRLAEAGLHVLRFDYFGTGDSPGEFEEARLERWVDDAAAALAELRHRFSVRHVYVAGLRLGAAVGWLAGIQHGGVDGLVLWDPVTSGPEYLDDIIAHESQRRQGSPARDLGDDRDRRGPREIVGFPMTEAMYADIAALDLLGVTRLSASRILLVDSSDDSIQEKLHAHLKGISADVRYEHMPHPKTWTQDPYKTVVPSKIIGAVARWVSDRER